MDKERQDKQNDSVKETELTKKYNKSYTYEDYLNWDINRKRYEIIDQDLMFIIRKIKYQSVFLRI